MTNRTKYHVNAWFEVYADNVSHAETIVRDKGAQSIARAHEAPKRERDYLKHKRED